MSAPPTADALAEMATRWAIGAAAAEAAPGDWRRAVAEVSPAEASLRLVALWAAAETATLRAAAEGALTCDPDLPPLAAPFLDGRARARLQRLLSTLPDRAADLLGLLAGRGWAAHPADWLGASGATAAPEADAEAIPLYRPWRLWRLAPALDAQPVSPDDGRTPAARAAALRTLREIDPDSGGAAFDALAAREPGAERARLIQALAVGLSAQDRERLMRAAADGRAQKARLAARSLLGRMGALTPDPPEETTRLAAKLLDRQGRLDADRPRTGARALERREGYERGALIDLAAALGRSEAALAADWPLYADGAPMLVQMAVRSGADASCWTLADRLAARHHAPAGSLAALAPRLTPPRRRDLAERWIWHLNGDFHHAAAIAGAHAQRGADGLCGLSAVAESRAGRRLRDRIAEAAQAGRRPPPETRREMVALGLLASREAVEPIVAALRAAGASPAEDALDVLALNASIPPREVGRAGTSPS